MSWLSIILLLIQYGPSIIHVVQEIIEFIRRRQQPDQAGLAAELDGAVRHYKKTKDRRPLRKLLERLRQEDI